MSRSLLCCFVVFLLRAVPVNAAWPDYPVIHFSTDDGLPSNTVYCIYRDSRGFLWIATDKGVVRYNGIRFEKFTTYGGLPDNEIFFAQEDHYGRVWFGSYNGELGFYKNDTFHTAANTPYLKLPFRYSFIKYIHLEKDSSVTLLYNEANVFLNIGRDNMRVFRLNMPGNHLDPYMNVQFIGKLSPERYRVITTDSVMVFNSDCDVLEKKPLPRRGMDCFPDQDRSYFFSGGIVFDEAMKAIARLSHFHTNAPALHRIFADGKDMFYCNIDGLIINDSFEILGGNNVSSMTRDNAGNYWVSTLNNGIYKLNKDFFSSGYAHNVYDKPIVYSCSRNNQVFFTTSVNDLYRFGGGKAECLFNYSTYSHRPVAVPPEPGFYMDSNFRYYMFYNDDHLVADHASSPIGRVTRYKNNVLTSGIKKVLNVGGITYLQNRSRIILVDENKVAPGDELRKGVISTIHEGPDPERIFCMAAAPDHTVWYSTVTDIFRIAGGRGVVCRSLPRLAFRYFNFFGPYLLGCTFDNKLLAIRNYNSVPVIDTIPPQDCVWDRFYEIDPSHILVCTDNLYRVLTLDTSGRGARVGVSVVENQFIPIQPDAICHDSAYCYFFKQGSVTTVPRSSLLVKPGPPQLYFSVLLSSKRAYPISSDVEIPYSEAKNLALRFSTVSFGGREISWQYMVTKSDSGAWLDTRGEIINFLNPEFGDYTIRLRARTISSDFSAPVSFTLHILRPFWARWWFIVLAMLSLAGIVYAIARYRLAQLVRIRERAHENELKFMKSEYKALNALMNPHFIFNTLNNVQGLVNRNDKLAANEYLRVFADLIRQNMHNISRELIPLQKEIDLVTNYLLLEKLRFKNHLNFRINFEDDIDLTDIMVPPLLVQPLVENSIKHGILPMESENSFVQLNIYEKSGLLYIEVKDNGAGLGGVHKAGQAHESFALENIKKRIAQLSVIQNKQITFHIGEVQEQPSGTWWTVVTITMPVD